jgi:dTDP-4-amino-4,6-dideoxygalactose transaminase
LDAFNDNRRAIAARYNERLAGMVQTPPERPWARAVYHMYVVRAQRRDELQKFLKENAVETGIHYPVANHQQPAITSKFGKIPALPRTEQAVKEILSLPIHGEMTLAAADVVCDTVAKFYVKK